MSADRPLCEQAHQVQVQCRLGSRLIVEGGPIKPEKFALPPYTQGRMLAIDHTPSLTDQSRQLFFQPLKFHLEPPDPQGAGCRHLFIKLCFLRLLLPLLALAVAGEDAGPVFQQLPFPGPYHVGMNLVFTR